jgi:hypothetical protein
MLDKTKLRKADAFTAIVLLVFGIWIIAEALSMPMKDSWGGVMNVWYVSPAIMPLGIGSAIILLSLALLVHAVKTVGLPELRAVLKRVVLRAVTQWPADGNVKFMAMASQLMIWIYVFIPRIDFLLTTIYFLMVFISMFYFQDMRVLKRLWAAYLAVSALFFAYFASGLGALAYRSFRYTGDVLMLATIIAMAVFIKCQVRSLEGSGRKYRIMLLIAILFPLFICPVFKFLLQVPLPYEGGIIGLMSLAKFRLFPR